MIKTFGNKDTEDVFNGTIPRSLLSDIILRAITKIGIINSAAVLADLRVPPSNRLEKLSGDRRVSGSFGSITSGASVFIGGTTTMPTTSKSATTTDLASLKPVDWMPVELLETPGDVLRIQFMEPMGITAAQLSRAISVPPQYISKVLHGGGISAELGVLLDRYFGLSDGFWSRLQADHNARIARRKLADHIARIEPYAG